MPDQKATFLNPEDAQAGVTALNDTDADTSNGGQGMNRPNAAVGVSTDDYDPKESDWSRDDRAGYQGQFIGQDDPGQAQGAKPKGFAVQTPVAPAVSFAQGGVGDFPAGGWSWREGGGIEYLPGQVIDQALTADWATTNGSVVKTVITDDPYHVFGQSLRISSDVDGTGILRTEPGTGGILDPADYDAESSLKILCWLNWAAVSGTDRIRVFIWHDHESNPTQNTAFTFNSFEEMQLGWNTLTIPMNWDLVGNRADQGFRQHDNADYQNWDNGGGGPWDPTQGISRIAIYVISMPNADWDGDLYAFHYCGMVYGDKMTPVVSICFDDGYEATLTEDHPTQNKSAFEYMTEKGFKGNVAVIRNNVGDTNYLDQAQLQTLYDAGWDMLVHGVWQWGDMNSWNNLVDNAINWEPGDGPLNQDDGIAYNRQYLIDQGWTRGQNLAVYPGNNYRQNNWTIDDWTFNLRQKMQELGIRACRTSWPVWDSPAILGAEQDAGSNYGKEWMTVAGSPIELNDNPWNSLSRFLNRGLETIVGVGGHSMIYLHRLVSVNDFARGAGDGPPSANGHPGTYYYIEDFFDILDELETRQNNEELVVMTFSEYYNAMTALNNPIFPSPRYSVPAD